MSLLKALQNQLTCTATPWFPVGSADNRYLINEIVVGEESDIDLNGKRISHFELYLDAMKQSGADTSEIESFINKLRSSGNFESAFLSALTPQEAISFVNYTFTIVASNKAHLQSAVFTFGREDLIPGMFLSVINEIHKNFPTEISIFKYYIERHIEVDGDHHSHLAMQMTEELCGDNEQLWQEAQEAVIASLQQRLALWDGVYKKITANKVSNNKKQQATTLNH
jgi:pyrroloquinoline quinone (PQQ) biosynthesis protein C